jgi:hypothetical protein
MTLVARHSYELNPVKGRGKDIEDSYRRHTTGVDRVDHCWKVRCRKITDFGKFFFVNRTSLTGIGYLKGRLGLPSLKRMYSERGLGKYISEVK